MSVRENIYTSQNRRFATDAAPGVRVTPPGRAGLRVTSSLVDPKRQTRSRCTKVSLRVATRRCEALPGALAVVLTQSGLRCVQVTTFTGSNARAF